MTDLLILLVGSGGGLDEGALVAPGVGDDGRSTGWSFLENLLARQGGLHSEGWDTWGHHILIAARGPPSVPPYSRTRPMHMLPCADGRRP